MLQDSGECGPLLGSLHSVVHAAGFESLSGAMDGQLFDAAVLVQREAPETQAIVAGLRAADPDLTIVMVANDLDGGSEPDGVWEMLRRPVTAPALRFAVARAMLHTAVLRENRILRGQAREEQRQALKQDAGNPPLEGDSAGPGDLHWIAALPQRFDLRDLLSKVEKNIIMQTLEATRGAQAEAARRLGLSRSDLSYKLAKYQLRKPVGVRAD